MYAFVMSLKCVNSSQHNIVSELLKPRCLKRDKYFFNPDFWILIKQYHDLSSLL